MFGGWCLSMTVRALLEKSVFLPLKIPPKMVLDMQNVMHIAPNAGHTVQNDGQTMQNVGRNKLNVCQGPKGGLRSPPGDPPYPYT